MRSQLRVQGSLRAIQGSTVLVCPEERALRTLAFLISSRVALGNRLIPESLIIGGFTPVSSHTSAPASLRQLMRALEYTAIPRCSDCSRSIADTTTLSPSSGFWVRRWEITWAAQSEESFILACRPQRALLPRFALVVLMWTPKTEPVLMGAQAKPSQMSAGPWRSRHPPTNAGNSSMPGSRGSRPEARFGAICFASRSKAVGRAAPNRMQWLQFTLGIPGANVPGIPPFMGSF